RLGAVGNLGYRAKPGRRSPRAKESRRPHHEGASVTQRSAFVLKIRPDKIEEYVEAHRAVWPEMLDALRAAGIRNYSIFRAGNEVFGYFESDDLVAAGRYMAEQKINSRWQDHM